MGSLTTHRAEIEYSAAIHGGGKIAMAPKRETATERFGRELRAACEAAGIHGKDLAKAINVAPSTLTNWMAGRHTPHPRDVERVEKVLKDKAPGYSEGYLKRYLKEWVAEEESPEWSEWMGVEHEATGLQAYENVALPGLNMPESYCRRTKRSSVSSDRRSLTKEFHHFSKCSSMSRLFTGTSAALK